MVRLSGQLSDEVSPAQLRQAQRPAQGQVRVVRRRPAAPVLQVLRQDMRALEGGRSALKTSATLVFIKSVNGLVKGMMEKGARGHAWVCACARACAHARVFVRLRVYVKGEWDCSWASAILQARVGVVRGLHMLLRFAAPPRWHLPARRDSQRPSPAPAGLPQARGTA